MKKALLIAIASVALVNVVFLLAMAWMLHPIPGAMFTVLFCAIGFIAVDFHYRNKGK